MRIQESLKVFRNSFDSILPNIKSKTGGVIKDLTELKSSLQFSQEEIDDLKPLTGQMTKIEKEIEVQAQVITIATKRSILQTRGTFLENPENFSGPKSHS